MTLPRNYTATALICTCRILTDARVHTKRFAQANSPQGSYRNISLFTVVGRWISGAKVIPLLSQGYNVVAVPTLDLAADDVDATKRAIECRLARTAGGHSDADSGYHEVGNDPKVVGC